MSIPEWLRKELVSVISGSPIHPKIWKLLWKSVKNKKNVIGCSKIYHKRYLESKDIEVDEVVFRIYVSKKEPISKLSSKELIPRALTVAKYFTIGTDLIVCSPKALSTRDKYRPIVAGISSNHKDGTACTITGFFIDKETNEVLVASCNHCYARSNKAKIGDIILQPSPYDGGTLKDKIGYLKKYVPLYFDRYTCNVRNLLYSIVKLLLPFYKKENKVDIAFSTLEVGYNNSIYDIGDIKGWNVALLDELVYKVGRTTGKTKGVIVDTAWHGYVQYDRGLALFTDCYLAKLHSEGGDSGSPVVNVDNELIGGLFAGDDTYSVICKINNLFKEANVDVVKS